MKRISIKKISPFTTHRGGFCPVNSRRYLSLQEMEVMNMFYVKESINDTLEIKVEIHDDNVFTTCPDCGVEIFLDISELFSDGESDLYGTAIFCPECSKSRLEEF